MTPDSSRSVRGIERTRKSPGSTPARIGSSRATAPTAPPLGFLAEVHYSGEAGVDEKEVSDRPGGQVDAVGNGEVGRAGVRPLDEGHLPGGAQGGLEIPVGGAEPADAKRRAAVRCEVARVIRREAVVRGEGRGERGGRRVEREGNLLIGLGRQEQRGLNRAGSVSHPQGPLDIPVGVVARADERGHAR